MSCDTKVKPRKPATKQESTLQNQTTEEKIIMPSSMVRREMPEFSMDAYDAKTGHFSHVTTNDYKGKWAVICFYPADFTFVCPTEIAAMNAKYDEFQNVFLQYGL